MTHGTVWLAKDRRRKIREIVLSSNTRAGLPSDAQYQTPLVPIDSRLNFHQHALIPAHTLVLLRTLFAKLYSPPRSTSHGYNNMSDHAKTRTIYALAPLEPSQDCSLSEVYLREDENGNFTPSFPLLSDDSETAGVMKLGDDSTLCIYANSH